MSSRGRSVTGGVARALDRGFEKLSARPLSLLVFLASAALLVYLQTSSVGHFRARAVGRAQVVEHPSLVASFISKVYVQPGDHVEAGTPLVDLSSYFIERELSQLNAEVEQLLHERNLAQARLHVQEERWLTPELRMRPSRPSLDRPTEAWYAAQLEVLQTRRSQLLETRNNLTVSSRISGRVALVVAPGSPVAVGSSVAMVTPEHAEEIVAYLPPDTDPARIEAGVAVRIASRPTSCGGYGTVLRRGAGVEQMPGQLDNFFGVAAQGMPVYISVPLGCDLGVGQVLAVEFPKAGM